jgi:uncharacterized protein YPO0396
MRLFQYEKQLSSQAQLLFESRVKLQALEQLSQDVERIEKENNQKLCHYINELELQLKKCNVQLVQVNHQYREMKALNAKLDLQRHSWEREYDAVNQKCRTQWS